MNTNFARSALYLSNLPIRQLIGETKKDKNVTLYKLPIRQLMIDYDYTPGPPLF